MNEAKRPEHLAKHVQKDYPETLKIMHSIHLIHDDITPENIE